MGELEKELKRRKRSLLIGILVVIGLLVYHRCDSQVYDIRSDGNAIEVYDIYNARYQQYYFDGVILYKVDLFNPKEKVADKPVGGYQQEELLQTQKIEYYGSYNQEVIGVKEYYDTKRVENRMATDGEKRVDRSGSTWYNSSWNGEWQNPHWNRCNTELEQQGTWSYY